MHRARRIARSGRGGNRVRLSGPFGQAGNPLLQDLHTRRNALCRALAAIPVMEHRPFGPSEAFSRPTGRYAAISLSKFGVVCRNPLRGGTEQIFGGVSGSPQRSRGIRCPQRLPMVTRRPAKPARPLRRYATCLSEAEWRIVQTFLLPRRPAAGCAPGRSSRHLTQQEAMSDVVRQPAMLGVRFSPIPSPVQRCCFEETPDPPWPAAARRHARQECL